MPSKIAKSLKVSSGYQHRDHRSRKSRKRLNVGTQRAARLMRLREEKKREAQTKRMLKKLTKIL